MMAGKAEASEVDTAAPSVSNNVGGDPSRPPLPLGWTQVRRVRKRPLDAIDGNRGDDNDMVWCCEDPSCSERTALFATKSSAAASDDAGTVRKESGTVRKERDTNNETKSPRTTVLLRGTAVLLLPDVDSTWFQGHFVPSLSASVGGGKSKPLGLLAVNRDDTDDCLKCAEGGYREMDLTLFTWGTRGGNSDGQRRRPRKIKFERAVCTGGDLVRLRATSGSEPGIPPSFEKASNGRPPSASFDADRVLTGRKAAPFVRRYFSSVLNRLGGDGGWGESNQLGDANAKVFNDENVGEVLPNCAIVLGDMQVTVPCKFISITSSFEASTAADNDKDCWMSD